MIARFSVFAAVLALPLSASAQPQSAPAGSGAPAPTTTLAGAPATATATTAPTTLLTPSTASATRTTTTTAPATAMGTAPETTLALLGKLEGTTYTAPGGTYKIAVPVLLELGGRVFDNESIVTFEDDFNTHVSVACFPLDIEQKWELDTRGVKDYLSYFFANYVLPDFRQRYPGTTVESARFVPSLVDGALLAYTLLPGGSFFEGKNAVMENTTEVPVLAKRGNLCFVRNGFVYVISSELAERATQRRTYNKTTEQEDQILRQRLIALVGKMEFALPSPAAAKRK